jgi:hypothetical protein
MPKRQRGHVVPRIAAAGVRKLACAVVCLATLGCGGGQTAPTTKSPVVTGDSPEFKAAAENAERIDKELKAAERKALGGKTIE